jgi:hypothetical protein
VNPAGFVCLQPSLPHSTASCVPFTRSTPTDNVTFNAGIALNPASSDRVQILPAFSSFGVGVVHPRIVRFPLFRQPEAVPTAAFRIIIAAGARADPSAEPTLSTPSFNPSPGVANICFGPCLCSGRSRKPLREGGYRTLYFSGKFNK